MIKLPRRKPGGVSNLVLGSEIANRDTAAVSSTYFSTVRFCILV